MASASRRKRPRESTTVNTDLVAIYEDLANENGEIRLKAALRLLSTKFEEDELKKILNRLFRGICSGRKAARLGFSIALTEFLAHYTGATGQFTPETILQVYEKQTDPAPGATGQELRDYYFGRLFAAEAIIKSKIMYKVRSAHLWPQFIDLILDLYEKKSWLREESGWVLYQAFKEFEGQPALFDSAAVIFQQLEARKLLKSLESIALWTTCKLGDFQGIRLPPHVFHNENPLHEKEQASLLAALKGTTTVMGSDEAGVKSSSSTTWSNKTHFAWTVIFEAAKNVDFNGLPLIEKSSSTETLFSILWQKFVDEHLFASSASEQRKYWGFLITQHFLNYSEAADYLLGSNFLRCLSNQLCKSDRHLHGIAVKTVKAVHAVVDADKEGSYAGRLLLSVVVAQHSVDFDRSSKSKFVEKLLAKASPAYRLLTVEGISRTMDVAPKSVDRSTTQWQIACADFLLACVKNYQAPKGIPLHEDHHKTMQFVIQLLTSCAYCKNMVADGRITQRKLEIDRQSRDIFRSRLLSALSHLITQSEDPSEFPTVSADLLLGLEKQHQTQPVSESPETILEIIRRAGRRMQKCGKKANSLSKSDKASNKIKVYRTFRLLLSLSIIQTFSGDPDAVDVLQELELASKNILDDHDQNSGHLISVIEIILSMLAKPSVLFRRVGKEVFSSFASMIEPDALEPLFNVLEKKENLSGQQQLFDANNGEEDVEGSDSGDSDVEEVNGVNGSDNETSSVDDDEADNEEILEFENKLALALGTQKATAEADEHQQAEDSDEDMMDDEQMAALDPMMTNMFKQHKQANSKKEHKDAKETIVTFKTKVLELLEIYVRQLDQGSSIKGSIAIVLNCLECVKDTKSKQVSEKAASVIKTALNVYKLGAEVRADKSVLRHAKASLRTVQDLLLKQGSNTYVRACSQASLFCAKVILNNGGTIERVWKEYCKTGEIMATSEDCKIVNVLFQDWFNWLGTAKVTLSKRI